MTDIAPGTAGDKRETRHRVTAAAADRGLRLDRLLAAALPTLSRTRLKALIEQGHVTTAGATITDPSRRVKPGESFVVAEPPPVPAAPRPQEIALAIVYEDDELIVIDKPAGLVVHPAAGNRENTLVNALLAHCGASLSGIGGVMRPGIVHRLDKDTSGLIVVAKTNEAHAALSRQIQDRTMTRAYGAVVWGTPRPAQGEITGNIGRNPRNRKKMAVVKRGGKPAATRYQVLKRLGTAASLVECRLQSGRTHQIRVHMASIGHAVIGDPVYGGRPRAHKGQTAGDRTQALAAAKRLGRQALHAQLIGFDHPRSGKRLEFSSDFPNDIKELIKCLEGS
jgi:23S rRNA pseudouridine1911/1915/1917 synthase